MKMTIEEQLTKIQERKAKTKEADKPLLENSISDFEASQQINNQSAFKKSNLELLRAGIKAIADATGIHIVPGMIGGEPNSSNYGSLPYWPCYLRNGAYVPFTSEEQAEFKSKWADIVGPIIAPMGDDQIKLWRHGHGDDDTSDYGAFTYACLKDFSEKRDKQIKTGLFGVCLDESKLTPDSPIKLKGPSNLSDAKFPEALKKYSLKDLFITIMHTDLPILAMHTAREIIGTKGSRLCEMPDMPIDHSYRSLLVHCGPREVGKSYFSQVSAEIYANWGYTVHTTLEAPGSQFWSTMNFRNDIARADDSERQMIEAILKTGKGKTMLSNGPIGTDIKFQSEVKIYCTTAYSINSNLEDLGFMAGMDDGSLSRIKAIKWLSKEQIAKNANDEEIKDLMLWFTKIGLECGCDHRIVLEYSLLKLLEFALPVYLLPRHEYEKKVAEFSVKATFTAPEYADKHLLITMVFAHRLIYKQLPNMANGRDAQQMILAFTNLVANPAFKPICSLLKADWVKSGKPGKHPWAIFDNLQISSVRLAFLAIMAMQNRQLADAIGTGLDKWRPQDIIAKYTDMLEPCANSTARFGGKDWSVVRAFDSATDAYLLSEYERIIDVLYCMDYMQDSAYLESSLWSQIGTKEISNDPSIMNSISYLGMAGYNSKEDTERLLVDWHKFRLEAPGQRYDFTKRNEELINERKQKYEQQNFTNVG